MRAFFASLYKDIKLFLSGAGALALLLPVLLLPALSLGMEDMGSAQYMQSFPIALRDEDRTVMSRSLISQMANIELFSEVRVLEEGVTDEEALAGGAVAVATIPPDFFNEVYRMADCPIEVTLNAEKPAESAVFEAIFRSVMGIIRANHASSLGTYTFAYGELTDDLIRQMRRETGDRLIVDALGRQRVFESMYESADLVGALTRRLAACVLGVLAIFFAISSAKTVPEERRLGVVPRFRARGLGMAGFTASKYLSALILSIPAIIPAQVLTETGFLSLFLLYALLLLTAFGVMLFIAALSSTAAGVQRWGNLILLTSLALGGVLWPVNGLPAPLRAMRCGALPYYASLALEAAAADLPGKAGLKLLLPVIFAAAASLTLSLIILSLPRRADTKGERAGNIAAGKAPAEPRPSGLFYRLSGLGSLRFGHFTGGCAVLAATLAVCLACGAAGSSILSSPAETLRIAACDLDGSELSTELIEQIASAPGVSLEKIDPEDVGLALITGGYEGVLTVGVGYGSCVEAGFETPLGFRASASSLTAQGAREIAAGAVLTQLRAEESVSDAQRLLGRPLTQEELPVLRRAINDAAGSLPELYHIAYSSGSAPSDPFAPSPMSFAALATLFTLLTAASFTASPDARMARRRLQAMAHGRLISVLSDLSGLAALGILTTLAVLLPSGLSPSSLVPVLATSLCMASLALLLARCAASAGRVDALAPLLSLLICLVGGCFMDTSSISPTLARLTLISPAGMAVRAFTGSAAAAAALLAESALFTAAAAGK